MKDKYLNQVLKHFVCEDGTELLEVTENLGWCYAAEYFEITPGDEDPEPLTVNAYTPEELDEILSA